MGYHNGCSVLALLFAVELLLSFHQVSTMMCIEEEREALLQLKASFLDPSNRLGSWKGLDCCSSWDGVACDDTNGHVIKLDLSNPEVNFSTALHTNRIESTLLHLKHLSYLDFSGNNFSYTKIPNFLGSFSELRHLDLSHAYFYGRVPPHLGNLTNLLVFNLNINDQLLFVDDLEWMSRLSSLQYLDLSGVNFENASNLMQVLSGLPSLLSLELRTCNLRHIHLSNGAPLNSSFLPKVQLLDLSNNMFNCPIPVAFQNMSSLRFLYLSSSGFNSVIPLGLGNLRNLVVVNLAFNLFSSIEGGLSKIVGNNCNLEVLDLSNNYDLSGDVFGKLSAGCNEYPLTKLAIRNSELRESSIPDWLGQLKNLKTLDLYNNSLQGHIPISFGNLTSIEILDLSRNMLSGRIPTSFAELLKLRELKLGKNNLDGIVPSLGSLQNLEVLDISENDLKGSVSEIHFTNLSRLNTLWLYGNGLLSLEMKSDWIPPFQLLLFSAKSCKGFSGEFPRWLQTQYKLAFLDLSNTSISGPIPPWFGGPSLIALDLSYNHINGSLPERIGLQMPSLGSLYLTENHISGALPQSICSIVRLTAIDLSANELSGTIPTCLLSSQIMLLDLSSNKFSEVFPTSNAALSPLDQLHLNNNNLGGELPIVLRNCKSLTLLAVAGNQFSGNIPTWLGESLENLRILNLRDNMFNGSIPSNLGRLPGLQNLDVAQNQLVGIIPPNLGNLSAMRSEEITGRSNGMAMYCFWFSPYCNYVRSVRQYFKSSEYNYSNIMQLPLMVNLDLSGNNLVGHIPTEMAALKGLLGLNLSHNSLSGTIPWEMGRMRSLQSLDLSFNHFSGSIPVSLSSLNSLGVLKLSNNNFSGRIPREGHLLTFNDESTFDGNPYLCGDPLPFKCPNKDSTETPLGSDDEEWEKWEKMLLYIMIMAGYAAGLWGVIGVLILKPRWRYAYFQFVDETKHKIHMAVQKITTSDNNL